MAEMNKLYAVVRLRGEAGTHHSLRKTLELMRLHKVNHATLLPATPSVEGMLKKVKDKVTWGEISKKDAIYLIKKRGELFGKDSKITDAYIKKNTEFKSIKDFVDKLFEGKAKITDIPNIQPVFRLSPPRKGFKSLKRAYTNSGDLGYRSDAMSDLIKRMA